MILFLTIIAVAAFLTTAGTSYYVFVQKPNKWQKLIIEIDSASTEKESLLNSITSINTEKTQLESLYIHLKEQTVILQDNWNILTHSLNVEIEELKTITSDKVRFQSEIQSVRAEIERLKESLDGNILKVKLTSTELEKLYGQKKNLQDSVSNLQIQFQALKREADELSERKTDLEKENSHLSLEIAKKKILLAAY
jgi:chromosome segregation ATPase